LPDSGIGIEVQQERLNADLKHAIGSKVLARTKAKLRKVPANQMDEREQRPEPVKVSFQDPTVSQA